jgi:hypothetical protein
VNDCTSVVEVRFEKMDRPDLMRVIKPRGGKEFGECLQLLRGDSCKPARSCAAPRAHERVMGPAWLGRSDIDRYGSSVTGCSPAKT